MNGGCGLIAEEVAAWGLVPTGIEDAVALSFRTPDGAEFAFVLKADDAHALREALAELTDREAGKRWRESLLPQGPTAEARCVEAAPPAAPEGARVLRFARRDR